MKSACLRIPTEHICSKRTFRFPLCRKNQPIIQDTRYFAGKNNIKEENVEDNSNNQVIIKKSDESPNGIAKSSGGSISAAVDKAAPSVVTIEANISYETYSWFMGEQVYSTMVSGSGIILSDDGYIITNNHIIADSDDIKVIDYNGNEYDANMVGVDESMDIAVLKINGNDLTHVTVGDSDNIKVGDTAIVIGNPLGTLGGTVTHGIISALNREITLDGQTYNLLQTDASINSGNSGGGLFDENGNLIGIINAKDSGITDSGTVIEGLGFAIPINSAIESAQEIIEIGKSVEKVSKASLGVYLPSNDDCTIVQLIPDGAAEKAGLKVGDTIVAIDDQQVSSYMELHSIISKHIPGDTVKVSIFRDNKMQEIDVTLQTIPEIPSEKINYENNDKNIEIFPGSPNNEDAVWSDIFNDMEKNNKIKDF